MKSIESSLGISRFKGLLISVSLFIFLPDSGITQHIEIESGQIKIEYNDQFERYLQWLPSGGKSMVALDPVIQPGISVNGKACVPFRLDTTKFTLSETNHYQFGKSLEAVVVGVFEGNGVKIERHIHIILPERFPNVLLSQTKYYNLSDEKIHIDSVYSERILLRHQLLDDDSKTYPFASFQGGINEWGRDYSLIWLFPGFRQDNFQGLHPTPEPEMIGGGMPIVDIWGEEMGVAIAHLEDSPQWLSLPVSVRETHTADFGILEQPDEKLGMVEWLKPNDYYETVLSAVIFHHSDFYEALQTYGDLLRQRGVEIPRTSPKNAYDPYWKSWGFELDFTLEEIYGILPELRSMGIKTANLDDGWFDYYGDWGLNRSPGKFPEGDAGMISFVDSLHNLDFKTNLWWYPLGVSPESKLAKEMSELLVQAEDGSYPVDSRNLYQFCPAYQPSIDYIRALVEKFIHKWNYDGLYSDTRGLSAVPLCFNKAHGHKTPLESFQKVPDVFRAIDESIKMYKEDGLHEVCICAVPHSPYNMPYYQIANASDPVSPLQMRRRIKVEKAIHGPTFAVGDCYQVPADEWSGFSVPQSFESAMGTGAQVTTFYTDLDADQLAEWSRWFGEYNQLELSRGEYVNLYDIAYDKPEIHVVKKDNKLFYGIFAELWSKEDVILLRGLRENVTYSIYDYGNKRSLGSATGPEAIVRVGFKDHLLLVLTPVNE